MSEPRRWREDGPEEARDLLRAGAPTRSIMPDQRARTAKRLARYASAAAVAASLSWVPGAALGAGIGVATVIVVWGAPALIDRSPSPPPAVTVTAPRQAPLPAISTAPTQVAPVPSAAPAPPPPAAPTQVAPAPSAVAPAPPAASGEPAPPVDRLGEEVALLDEARAALSTSPATALVLAETHAARFPGGKMGMERDLLAVDALRRLGRTGEARARAEAMLARAEGSLYEARVRKLLEQMK